jgi:signal peptidase I
MYGFSLLTIGAILVVLIDKFFLVAKRNEENQIHAQLASLGYVNETVVSAPPVWVKWAREYWHWIAIVYIVRAFGFESFSIPSSSMMPTLLVGEQVLVNKYQYGLTDPLFRHELLEMDAPERGDVVVFRSPEHPDTDYVKRVIGVPGDTISYVDKVVYINRCSLSVECEDISFSMHENGNEYIDSDATGMTGYTVMIDNTEFDIALSHDKPMKNEIVDLYVPEGHYFVMGDNRDNSRDSRDFGLIKDAALVGKASARWLHIQSNDTLVGKSISLQRVGKVE